MFAASHATAQQSTRATEAIPVGLLPFEYQRRAPYIYSDKDIEALLLAALALPAKDGLANHTYHCLLGLLSVTGLRISEATNLTLDDVDWSTAS